MAGLASQSSIPRVKLWTRMKHCEPVKSVSHVIYYHVTLCTTMPTEHLSIFDPFAVTTQVDTLPRCLLCFAGLLQPVKLPHFYVWTDHFCMARLIVAYVLWIHECGDGKICPDASVRKILLYITHTRMKIGQNSHSKSGVCRVYTS